MIQRVILNFIKCLSANQNQLFYQLNYICIGHVLRDIVYLHSLLDLIFAYTYNLFVSLFYFTIFQEKRIPSAINVCIYHILVIFFIEGCQYLIKHAHVAYTSKSPMFYMQNHGTQTLLLLFEVYI